jgi:hypothetical protein
MLAVLSSAVLLSFFSLTSSSAETYNHTEEYMQQHDGDRAEYLQEMEHSDPLFYVPPVNSTSPSSTTDSNISAK